MKRFIVPLLTAVMVVSMILTGCVPGVAPPVTPPVEPVTPPVEPVTPPVEPVTPPVVEWPPPGALTVADIPELQGLVASGAIDPDLLMNPYEGLAIKPDGTPFKFACLSVSMGNEFFTDGMGIQQSLIERAGGDFSMFNVEWDIAAAASWYEDQVAVVHPDAIIDLAANEEAMIPSVAKAMEAGIPVITWGVVVNGSLSKVHHHHDGPAGTCLAGQYFVEFAEARGEPFYLLENWCPSSFETCRERDRGLHMATDKCDLITIIDSAETFCTPEDMFTVTQDNFTAHPEIGGVFCMTGGGDGAIEALRALGRLYPVGHPDHVAFIAETSSPLFEMLLMRDESPVDGLFTHHSWDEAEISVKLMFTHLILGEPVPYHVQLPMMLITPENANTPEGKMYGCPAICSGMPIEQWDVWPVLDTSAAGIEARGDPWIYCDGVPCGIEIPTRVMRMELQGY